ncbi:MAG TPA: hypothetical protein VGN64_00305 [Dyadobacter sp.]|jgi:hypothetical protein|nr:hypothetical protein [Dyadobacter sp.]
MGPFGDDDDDLYDDDLSGDFPASDDIFRRGLKDEEIDPEFLGREKLVEEDVDRWGDKDEDDKDDDDSEDLDSELEDDDDL